MESRTHFGCLPPQFGQGIDTVAGRAGSGQEMAIGAAVANAASRNVTD